MKRILTQLATPAAAALFALTLGAASPANAAEYCRIDVSSHMMSCSFTTLEQCQATSAGRGGDCVRDPFLASPANAFAYAPGRAKAKKPAAH